MRTDAQLILRLAVPSVLYAPLYLAKILSHEAEARDKFSIFQHVEFDYAGKPYDSVAAVDELILPVLRARERSLKRPATVLAVGDPTRIASALAAVTTSPYAPGRLDTPYIVGGLITKMCYWLMDDRGDAGYGTREEFDEVVVHPKGMTGYSLFRYEVQENVLPSAQAVLCFPGDELRVYTARTWCERDYERAAQRFSRAWRQQAATPQRLPSAFLTTDPALAVRTHRGRRWRLIHAYGRDPRTKFQQVLMTALITGQDVYNQPHRRPQIDAIVHAIAEAVALIKTDELLAAVCLLNYADQRIDFGNAYDVDELALHLEELTITDSFNPHPELKVSESHLRNAVEIRRAAAIPEEATSLQTLQSRLAEYVKVLTCLDHAKQTVRDVITLCERRPPQTVNGAASSYLRRTFSEEHSERERLNRWRVASVIIIVVVTLAIAIRGARPAAPSAQNYVESATGKSPLTPPVTGLSEVRSPARPKPETDVANRSKVKSGPLAVSVILLIASVFTLYEYFVFIGEQQNRRGRSGIWASLSISAAISASLFHGLRTVAELLPEKMIDLTEEALWPTLIAPFSCALVLVLLRELRPVARERLWWTVKEEWRKSRVLVGLLRRGCARSIEAFGFQTASMVVSTTFYPARKWHAFREKQN